MRDDDLATYLGSSHSALGLVLFGFGIFALLAVGTVMLTTGSFGSEALLFVLAVIWGLVAIPLGLAMRRKEPSVPALLTGCVLLTFPMGLALFSRF